MFIISKRNFLVRRADGSPYRIKKDYIGEIPQDVFESSLIRGAIKGGLVAAPESHRDKELHRQMRKLRPGQMPQISVRMLEANRKQNRKRRRKTVSRRQGGKQSQSKEARACGRMIIPILCSPIFREPKRLRPISRSREKKGITPRKCFRMTSLSFFQRMIRP